MVFSERFLEKKIDELIKQKTGSENKIYFEGIVYVRRLTKSTEELISVLKLSKNIKDNKLSLEDKNAIKMIKNHVKKFGWLGCRWKFEPGWNESDIRQRIERYLAGDPAKEIKNVLEPREKAEKITKEFIKKYKLSKQEKELIDLVKEFVYLRTFRTEGISRANFSATPMINQCAEKLNISKDELIELGIDEIIDSLRHKFDYKVVITERKKGFYLIQCDDVIMSFSGDERKVIDDLGIFKSEKVNTKIVSGQTAWRGIAKGRVIVISNPSEISRVKEGDILVATMTFPNYIPAMERAAAFITDEGGILCHAAIISREMKKPCIIGTKIATKVLKDGDLVEVDADKGIVKIIKN